MTNNFKPRTTNNNRTQLSPSEWAEKKQIEKETVYHIIDETATEIVEDPEKFKAFLASF